METILYQIEHININLYKLLSEASVRGFVHDKESLVSQNAVSLHFH